MDITEYSKTDDVKNRLKNKCSELQTALDSGKNEVTLLSPYEEEIILTKEHIELGLLLLNGKKELRKKEYWSIGNYIDENDKRHKHFLEHYNFETVWNEHAPLLDYLFGEWWTPHLITAWNNLPTLAYQEGYARRSFRAPNWKGFAIRRQLNFIIESLNNTRFYFKPELYPIHANSIGYHQQLSHVWAAAYESGDETISNLLLDIVYNRHPEGKVSRGVIKALLLTENAEAHEAIEKLLLSAQRQEGLRQEILECLDETSLSALKHMMKVVIDNKLSRFSSVVRALDVWIGLGWESERETTVKRFLEEGYHYLINPSEIPQAIKEKDNTKVYMALWAQGVLDAEKCFPYIDELIGKGTDEKKILVLYFTYQLGFDEKTVLYCFNQLKSDKLIIQAQAIRIMNHFTSFVIEKEIGEENRLWLKNRLYELVEQVPAKQKEFSTPFESMGGIFIEKAYVYDRLVQTINIDDESEVREALTHFEKMPLSSREQLNRRILNGYSSWEIKETTKAPTPLQREYALMGLSDKGTSIRTASMNALMNAEITDEELQKFEDLLSRKSSELRKQVIGMIMKRGEDEVKVSVSRLLQSRNADQRLAGLDMLCQLHKKDSPKWITEKAEAFAERAKISTKEQILLDNLLQEDSAQTLYTADNGFGLFDPSNISASEEPQTLPQGYYREATQNNLMGLSMSHEQIIEELNKLKKLFEDNSSFEYERKYYDGSTDTVLLGNYFSSTSAYDENGTLEEKFYSYPLAEVWKQWFEDSKLTPLDLLLINTTASRNQYGGISGGDQFPEIRKMVDEIVYPAKVPNVEGNPYSNPLLTVLNILAYIFPCEQKDGFLYGLVCEIFSRMDKIEVGKVVEKKSHYGSNFYTWHDIRLINEIWSAYSSRSYEMNDEEFANYWKLTKWRFEINQFEGERKNQYMPNLWNYSRAYKLELIGYDELVNRIMFDDSIRQLTVKKFSKNETNYFEPFPFLKEIIDKCRDRIFEIELTRGDTSTAVTRLAQNLQVIYGADNFVKLLTAMGKDNLHRGYIYSWGSVEYNKKEVLSTLLKRCWPSESDSQKEFNKLVKDAKITDKRIVEAAMYAPQWMHLVGSYVKWKGFESAIWWLHAHTNGTHTAETETEIGRYSPVEIREFNDGAVDVDWFKEAYKALGKAKWKVLYDAAKYVSDGTGHSRAKLYADVIVGNTKITEVRKRVVDKRNQDYLRVYGLVPLSRAKRDKDLLTRYQFLQKFLKESKQFGSQRQTSEALAVKISMENLARTAGYSDPIRLTWAMETEEAKTILQSAEKLIFDDLEIWLEVDEHGKSDIKCTRKGKALKNVPAKFNKDKSVAELKAFHKTLKNQYSRTKKSLEDAMVTGQVFFKSEVETLMGHPVVKPMLEKLLLKSGDTIGFWKDGSLCNYIGDLHECAEEVSIAHCTDIYNDGHWSDYQHYCFTNQIAQPFKQIFRELYMPTEDELKATSVSRRYAGHQVQPKKTVALLKTKAWTVDYEEGLQKVFHKEGFIAKMYAMADWFSPADVESPALETVEFIDRKTYKTVPFESIDNRIFSEVMRDIDLVVSVAHVGDVDPEASHSSIEMRAVLVKEVAQMFKLDNVTVEKNHVFIKGEMGEYSVHLGSAVCHKQPGKYLSILPVHSQHRGRIFLPFVDDDPKSAELMSKVIMLAKDKEIQDPTVLRQIQTMEVDA